MELTLEQALQKGIEAHKAGKVQEADQYYTAILKANPKHPDANHNMGVLAVGVGRVQEALPFFTTALEANPKIAQYWVSYIDALIKLDRMDDAKAVFEQATSNGAKGDAFDQIEKQLRSLPSKSLDAQKQSQGELQILINCYTQGQYQEALNEATNLLIKFPNSINLYNIIGAANQGLGKLDKAIEAYTKALSIQPDYAEAHNNMGNALQEQGKLDAAIKAYNKAIAIEPDFAEPHNNIGISLKDQGKLVEAIKALEKALSIKPNYAEAYNNMGNALKDQGKPEEAIEAYKKAISIKPEYADAYNNMGNALKDQGKLNKGMEAYKKAISIKPEYADAYNNMGNALKDQGKLNEGMEAYKKAISIKPDYALAYNNMGNALKDQEKLDEAIWAYNKAISIKTDYSEAYSNIGLALTDQGKLEEAIEAYTKAIFIKPDFAHAWHNLYFPIQALKYQKKSSQSLNAFYPKDINSNSGNIQLSLLDYKLNCGREREGVHLDKALESLSSAENISIKNPKFDENTHEKIQSPPDKTVALVHFGRSGTGLMHSLIDGHPEVSTLPSIYFSEYFDHSTWARIISDGWDGMVDHFILLYDVLFDAASSVSVACKGKKFLHDIGIKEGMANLGEGKNEVLKVDKDLFRTDLKRLMACYYELDAFVFFRLVHQAYDIAINDFNSKNLVFYHIHNPDTYAQLNFIRSAPETKWIVMVREPLQSLESWVNREKEKNWYLKISNNILSMLFVIDNSIYSRQSSLGLRLEDIKKQPEKTIQALCKWMGIKEENSLYEMTAQSKKWWGDPNSPDYSKDGMEPFGKTSINRKIGSIFSEKDQFILRTLFYPFSVRFGYTEENKEQFIVDLQKIRPMIDEIFDFEKDIAEKMQMSFEKLIGSGSYLYLRSGLIERWNTLTKYQTYPKMIMPLKI